MKRPKPTPTTTKRRSRQNHLSKAAALLTPPKQPALVRIDWIDSTSLSGWINSHSASRVPLTRADMECHTVGYVVHLTKLHVTVTTTLTDEGEEWAWHAPFSIPLGCIRRVARLLDPLEGKKLHVH